MVWVVNGSGAIGGGEAWGRKKDAERRIGGKGIAGVDRWYFECRLRLLPVLVGPPLVIDYPAQKGRVVATPCRAVGVAPKYWVLASRSRAPSVALTEAAPSF